MRVEPRRGGRGERQNETRPYTERTLTVTTKFGRFTARARPGLRERFTALMGLLFDPAGRRESFERQG
jgi:hypothetical protein